MMVYIPMMVKGALDRLMDTYVAEEDIFDELKKAISLGVWDEV